MTDRQLCRCLVYAETLCALRADKKKTKTDFSDTPFTT